MTRAPHRDFKLQSSELWGNKNDLSTQLQIQLIGFEPNLSHFSFLKSLHKKHAFRTFWGLSGGGRSRFYKRGCACVCYYKVQCMTQVIQKLGHHASNLCFVTLWVKGTLSMDSLNLGETWLLDKKSRNLAEWDRFRLWLVIAYNRQNRCDKSTAQRFWTAIVRAMGQQKRSKRTTSNSIDWFWTKSVPFFLLKVST